MLGVIVEVAMIEAHKVSILYSITGQKLGRCRIVGESGDYYYIERLDMVEPVTGWYLKHLVKNYEEAYYERCGKSTTG
jgi:hypothetical protein